MATFLMFGKYSPESLQDMSAERTKKVVDRGNGRGIRQDDSRGVKGSNGIATVVAEILIPGV